MNVTFCGHSQVSNPDVVTRWLHIVTQELIEQGAVTFYLGGYGEFDSLAASVLREKKKLYPQIELILVIPYLNTSRDTLGYDNTVYPPLESIPPRYAIPKRNQWMVEVSDVVIAYVLHNWGGAATTLQYARRKKKKLVLFEKCEGKR